MPEGSFIILVAMVGIITQVTKKAANLDKNIEDRAVPVIALLLGVGLSTLFPDLTLIEGFFAAASSIGLYAGTKKTLQIN